jgi:hypothetical protein
MLGKRERQVIPSLMFLRSPTLRKRAGKHGDGEIGPCAAVGNGFDDARRHEGARGDVPSLSMLRRCSVATVKHGDQAHDSAGLVHAFLEAPRRSPGIISTR